MRSWLYLIFLFYFLVLDFFSCFIIYNNISFLSVYLSAESVAIFQTATLLRKGTSSPLSQGIIALENLGCALKMLSSLLQVKLYLAL